MKLDAVGLEVEQFFLHRDLADFHVTEKEGERKRERVIQFKINVCVFLQADHS